MENVRLFRNWSDEDFEWKWGGELYSFPAKSAKHLPEFLANHFAKHLTDRELHKAGQPTDMPIREVFLAKCFSEEESFQVQSAAMIDAEIKNKEEGIEPVSVVPEQPEQEEVTEVAKPKRGRPPKIV